MQDLGADRAIVLQYWHTILGVPKGLHSAIILITWEIWKERNGRILINKSSMPSALLQRIKDESKNWIMAGAKQLAEISS
jgi:hypothetical protein